MSYNFNNRNNQIGINFRPAPVFNLNNNPSYANPYAFRPPVNPAMMYPSMPGITRAAFNTPGFVGGPGPGPCLGPNQK